MRTMRVRGRRRILRKHKAGRLVLSAKSYPKTITQEGTADSLRYPQTVYFTVLHPSA